MDDTVDRDVALGHCFEQRGLCAGCRAVDLVEEQHVVEQRPRMEVPGAVLLVEHGDTGDVRREEVDGALHASGRAADRARERLGEERLAHAGRVLDEDVATREQRRHHEADRIRLAEHRALPRS